MACHQQRASKQPLAGKSSENCTIVNGATLPYVQVPEDRASSREAFRFGGCQNLESGQIKPYFDFRRWADQRQPEWLLLPPIAPGHATHTIHAIRGWQFLFMSR